MKDKQKMAYARALRRWLRHRLKQANVRRSKNGYLRHAARKLGATPPVIDRNSRGRQAIPFAVRMAIKETRRQQNNG